MEMDIRRATPDDADRIRSLVDDAYERYVERIGRRPAPMDNDYDQLIAATNVWVSTQNQAIVGVIVVEQRADHLFIDTLAVDPGSQGLGIGIHLLAHAEKTARRAGTPELRLYTNELMTENLTYYPHRGFIETHRARSAGFHRVFYSKPLRSG